MLFRTLILKYEKMIADCNGFFLRIKKQIKFEKMLNRQTGVSKYTVSASDVHVEPKCLNSESNENFTFVWFFMIKIFLIRIIAKNKSQNEILKKIFFY